MKVILRPRRFLSHLFMSYIMVVKKYKFKYTVIILIIFHVRTIKKNINLPHYLVSSLCLWWSSENFDNLYYLKFVYTRRHVILKSSGYDFVICCVLTFELSFFPRPLNYLLGLYNWIICCVFIIQWCIVFSPLSYRLHCVITIDLSFVSIPLDYLLYHFHYLLFYYH